MQQTVLFREEGSASSLDDCGGNSLVAEFNKTQFAGNHRAPRTARAQSQAGGWMRKIARAIVSMEVPLRPTIDRCIHELSKGRAKRIYFARGGRISCCIGKVWITLDRGGEDIVLTARECKDFDPGARVLIEALAESQVLLEAL